MSPLPLEALEAFEAAVKVLDDYANAGMHSIPLQLLECECFRTTFKWSQEAWFVSIDVGFVNIDRLILVKVRKQEMPSNRDVLIWAHKRAHNTMHLAIKAMTGNLILESCGAKRLQLKLEDCSRKMYRDLSSRRCSNAPGRQKQYSCPSE